MPHYKSNISIKKKLHVLKSQVIILILIKNKKNLIMQKDTLHKIDLKLKNLQFMRLTI